MNKPKPKKEWTYWYCPKRGMVKEPLVWDEFPGPRLTPSIPVPGALILAEVEGYRGLVLRIPRTSTFDATVALLRKHHVRFWAYPPALPAKCPLSDHRNAKSTVPLTCNDWVHNAEWVVPSDHVRSMAILAIASLEAIAKGRVKGAKSTVEEANDTLKLIRDMEAHHGTSPLRADFDL